MLFFNKRNNIRPLQGGKTEVLCLTLTTWAYWDKPAASFCRLVATAVLYMFCNFFFVKNHKSDNNSTTTEARNKINADLESIELTKGFDVCLTKF